MIKVIYKISRKSSMILISIVASLVPVLQVKAIDTGEYPWADAPTINAATYDWGYTNCPALMQQSNVCHISLTRSGKKYFVSDPWKYALRNCTSYVAWRVSRDKGIAIPGWGNANNWDNAARRAGYPVDNQPRVGDIAVWEGYYGHVAYVVAVNPDNSVNVEQYNMAGTGQFSRQSRVRAPNYIHLPSPPAPAPATPVVPVPVAPATSAAPTASNAETVAAKPPEPPKPVEVKEPVDPGVRKDAVAKVIDNYKIVNTDDAFHTTALDPKSDQVNIFAIQFNKTTSGRVEVSKSDGHNGNSTWSNTHAVNELAHDKNQAAYSIADYDSDGMLDLYQIKYANNTSNYTEVRVFSGSTTFKKIIGTWKTPQPTDAKITSSYSLADHNGDGSIDIYSIQSRSEEKTSKVTILSGASNFSQSLGEWPLTDAEIKPNSTFVIGDYDRDGKVDVYQVNQAESETKVVEVKVLNAASDYQDTLRKWTAVVP